jgi:hypothetical protein
MDDKEVLRKAYSNFNARNIDEVLSLMQADVEWANGMEGGHVFGREAVRAYWTHQWNVVDPHVEPLAIDRDDSGREIVTVHQVVRDLTGEILMDRTVWHAYRMRDGLIQRMDIFEEQPITH